MAQHLRKAREAVQSAAEEAEANVREQLLHVDEGLMEIVEGDKVEGDAPPKRDRLEEIEEKVVGLADETESEETRRRLEEVRDHLDSYRRARGIPEEERGDDG